MIDGCNEVLSGAEPEGPMADGLDLVVHSLDCAVGDTVQCPSQDSIECTNFWKGSSRERMAERIHFSKWSSARLGCL